VTAIITGMSGFVGQHLAAWLQQAGNSIAPLDVQTSCAQDQSVDLLDARQVEELVQGVQPERVYHLAGQSNVAASWKEPKNTIAVNVEGTRHLLEALRRHAPRARVLLISTGAVYGPPSSAHALFKEDDQPRPASPYAESKLAAERLGAEYFQQYRLDVRRVRPLGHTGPGQRQGFVVPDFAAQIAAIAAGQAPARLKVGNLAVAREFSDVRDVVRAYETILEQGEPGGLYNLAANEPHTVREVAQTLMAIAGVKAELQPDPDLMRPADESSPRLDTTRVLNLGFRYRIPFRQTLADVLAEWTAKTKS
jgi:GDP-4-dehydro-6-deoxy-D-mannose reductase